MARPKKFNREGVLDKAIPIFWKFGLAGTNVQTLEAETGVNKSGLYSEFDSKEDLFVAALQRYLETGPALRILETSPPGFHNIEQFLLHAPTFSADHAGCLSINSTRDVATLPEKAVRLIADFNARRMQAIRANVEAAVTADRVEAICDLIWTYFSGLCIDANLHTDGLQHEKRVQQFMTLVRAGSGAVKSGQ
ncbi:TetR/AcrR family transcriptional regulator [Rhizobium oryzicola]|uniref:TetR/AcrR family transcriptional regulator n=1 Tax=Rhizobium oryzicola TaxID=1232668 RepID=A0ABT8SZX7_9HYPH|nr:TetR/AcrR family transcriptional regulator [Rhizobium oryzicola]MDO1583448.1 TetR/AcrR family transcriptional regulator [Rhizobium oryzicola]